MNAQNALKEKKKVNYYVKLFKGGPDPKAQVPKHPEARECFVKYADSQIMHTLNI